MHRRRGRADAGIVHQHGQASVLLQRGFEAREILMLAQIGDDEDYECDEHELKKYLQDAHQAPESGLDIWEIVDKILPGGEF